MIAIQGLPFAFQPRFRQGHNNPRGRVEQPIAGLNIPRDTHARIGLVQRSPRGRLIAGLYQRDEPADETDPADVPIEAREQPVTGFFKKLSKKFQHTRHAVKSHSRLIRNFDNESIKLTRTVAPLVGTVLQVIPGVGTAAGGAVLALSAVDKANLARNAAKKAQREADQYVEEQPIQNTLVPSISQPLFQPQPNKAATALHSSGTGPTQDLTEPPGAPALLRNPLFLGAAAIGAILLLR